MYVHSQNWKAKWIGTEGTPNGFWTFFDETNTLGTMYEMSLTGSHYPLSGNDWTHFKVLPDSQIEAIVHKELRITCLETATPTRTPSNSNHIFKTNVF